MHCMCKALACIFAYTYSCRTNSFYTYADTCQVWARTTPSCFQCRCCASPAIRPRLPGVSFWIFQSIHEFPVFSTWSSFCLLCTHDSSTQITCACAYISQYHCISRYSPFYVFLEGSGSRLIKRLFNTSLYSLYRSFLYMMQRALARIIASTFIIPPVLFTTLSFLHMMQRALARALSSTFPCTRHHRRRAPVQMCMQAPARLRPPSPSDRWKWRAIVLYEGGVKSYAGRESINLLVRKKNRACYLTFCLFPCSLRHLCPWSALMPRR